MKSHRGCDEDMYSLFTLIEVYAIRIEKNFHERITSRSKKKIDYQFLLEERRNLSKQIWKRHVFVKIDD